MIKLIVAVDSNYGIGYKNELLFRISEDLKRFKELTTGHFVVMGRKTYESLPKTLPNRVNVVVTRNSNYNPKDNSVIVESDLKRMVSLYKNTGEQQKDIWVIGGAEIYKAFLPYADEIHLTHIHKVADNVDTFFPHKEMKELGFEAIDSERIFSEQENCKVTFVTYSNRPKTAI